MKPTTLATLAIALVLLSSGPPIQAEPETWTINRDTSPDGRVGGVQNLHVELDWSGSRIADGTYVDTPGLQHHNCVYTGNTDTGRGQELLYLRMTNDRAYLALHVGRKTADGYEGTWIDNEGNQGDFRLRRGAIGEPVIALHH